MLISTLVICCLGLEISLVMEDCFGTVCVGYGNAFAVDSSLLFTSSWSHHKRPVRGQCSLQGTFVTAKFPVSSHAKGFRQKKNSPVMSETYFLLLKLCVFVCAQLRPHHKSPSRLRSCVDKIVSDRAFASSFRKFASRKTFQKLLLKVNPIERIEGDHVVVWRKEKQTMRSDQGRIIGWSVHKPVNKRTHIRRRFRFEYQRGKWQVVGIFSEIRQEKNWYTHRHRKNNDFIRTEVQRKIRHFSSTKVKNCVCGSTKKKGAFQLLSHTKEKNVDTRKKTKGVPGWLRSAFHLW